MYKIKLFRGKGFRRMISLALIAAIMLMATACGSSAKVDGTAADTGDNSITISVITKDAYLDTAVKLFQEQNPGVTINVEEYTSEPIPKTDGKSTMIRAGEKAEDIEKYRNAVNTQLMSGKGPDIMLLNQLPYENYIDKKMLANLSDMMQADKSFNMDEYYTNIFDALEYNGSLYGLPTSVNLGVLEANTELLGKYGISIEDESWTWEDFEKAAETIVESSKKDGVEGIYALSGMDGSSLLTSLVSKSLNKFVDKDTKTAAFDSKEFIDLMNIAKSMLDKNYINTDTSRDKADMASRGNTVFSAGNIMNYMDMMMAKQIYDDSVEFLKYPGDGQDRYFTVNNLFGINEKSPDKELAWEFLKFLVSEEMLSQPSLVGLPVNKAASQAAAQSAIEMSKNISSGKAKIALNRNGQTLTLNKLITEADTGIVQALLEKANTYNKIDLKILSIIEEETKAFFNGQKTAEAAAKTIQDRVDLYINE